LNNKNVRGNFVDLRITSQGNEITMDSIE